VGLAAGIDGLVHLSDLSWNEPGEAAVRNYKKGQEVEAIVLAVDVDDYVSLCTTCNLPSMLVCGVQRCCNFGKLKSERIQQSKKLLKTSVIPNTEVFLCQIFSIIFG
jgi:hypothetical protein